MDQPSHLPFIFNLLPSFIFAIIGALLSVFFAKILKQNGRVLNEIKETGKRMDEGFRILGSKMDEGFRKMDERAEQRHREVMETSEQRHSEVIELLKRGFGDLHKDIRELKAG
jgi:hypothetical protein